MLLNLCSHRRNVMPAQAGTHATGD
jgi:hypothetical protein